MSEPNLLEEEELSPDHALTFREIFGAKMMDVRSMSGLIRFITGIGIAQIVVAVLLIGLNFVDLPSIAITREDGTVNFTVSIPVIATCVIFMVAAWSWLVVGALHSRLLLRIPILSLFFSLHLFLFSNQSGTVTGWLVLAFALIYVIWHGLMKPQGYVRDLLVVGLGLAFCYLAMIDYGYFVLPNGELFVSIMSLQIGVLSFFLMPLFLFAGLDLGESVRDLTRWFIGQGVARTGSKTLVWFAVAFNGVKLVYMLANGDLNPSWSLAGMFLLVVGYLSVRMRPWEGLYQEPQFGILFAGAISVIVMTLGAVVVSSAFGTGNFGNFAFVATSSGTGLVAGLFAWVISRRRLDAGGRTAVTFLLIYAFWSLAHLMGHAVVWNDLLGLPGNGFVDLGALDGALAILLPCLLFALHRRGLATKSVVAWALSLTAGLSVVRGMYWLVDNNFDLPAMTAAGQLIILAIGLLWDVLTSGDRWTNGHSERVPRSARVLLYFGYVSLTITAILYWKGSGQSAVFDEDFFATMGLILLGVPLYLYGFARAGVLLVRQEMVRQKDAQ